MISDHYGIFVLRCTIFNESMAQNYLRLWQRNIDATLFFNASSTNFENCVILVFPLDDVIFVITKELKNITARALFNPARKLILSHYLHMGAMFIAQITLYALKRRVRDLNQFRRFFY